MLGGESFFVNNYIAKGGGCSTGLTGAPIGDIIKVEIGPENGLIVQSGSYRARSRQGATGRRAPDRSARTKRSRQTE